MEVFVCRLLLFDIYKYHNDGDCYEVENASLNLSVAVIQSSKGYKAPAGTCYVIAEADLILLRQKFFKQSLVLNLMLFYGNLLLLSLI